MLVTKMRKQTSGRERERERDRSVLPLHPSVFAFIINPGSDNSHGVYYTKLSVIHFASVQFDDEVVIIIA